MNICIETVRCYASSNLRVFNKKNERKKCKKRNEMMRHVCALRCGWNKTEENLGGEKRYHCNHRFSFLPPPSSVGTCYCALSPLSFLPLLHLARTYIYLSKTTPPPLVWFTSRFSLPPLSLSLLHRVVQLVRVAVNNSLTSEIEWKDDFAPLLLQR